MYIPLITVYEEPKVMISFYNSGHRLLLMRGQPGDCIKQLLPWFFPQKVVLVEIPWNICVILCYQTLIWKFYAI